MEFVVTLIANPDIAPLTPEIVKRVEALLRKNGCETTEPDWLASDIACDIPFDECSSAEPQQAIRSLTADLKIDCVIQPCANRRKRLLLADMDSTIVTSETLDELAALAGIKEQIAAITERAMRGEIDFKDALRERVSMLGGLSADALNSTLEKIELTAGAHQLVKTMRENGAYTVLVSGGFSFFTNAIAKLVGFHEDRSNTMVIENGIITGDVSEPILDRDAKLKTLNEISAAKSIPLIETMATGDGANDLPMIMNAGLGVAYHAKPLVEEKAPAAIRYGDLTALLYIQGYRREEFRD
ncbi:MAG: phosphoserine phosphatase SerB [Rhodospirillaceae bacterium]|nr:phosphoserine phosphatase SerB [Rhodospirillaceae bacterium]|tara:strand:+ start:24490 stop:25386 length:897 start_codon:yes stop_codon:yes gene_type:complete